MDLSRFPSSPARVAGPQFLKIPRSPPSQESVGPDWLFFSMNTSNRSGCLEKAETTTFDSMSLEGSSGFRRGFNKQFQKAQMRYFAMRELDGEKVPESLFLARGQLEREKTEHKERKNQKEKNVLKLAVGKSAAATAIFPEKEDLRPPANQRTERSFASLLLRESNNLVGIRGLQLHRGKQVSWCAS